MGEEEEEGGGEEEEGEVRGGGGEELSYKIPPGPSRHVPWALAPRSLKMPSTQKNVASSDPHHPPVLWALLCYSVSVLFCHVMS